MVALADMRIKLKGAHRVVARLASGKVTIYWYRFRGGPLLMKFEGADRRAAEQAEQAAANDLIEAFGQKQPLVPGGPQTLSDLVTLYKGAKDGFGALNGTTPTQWAPWLDRIRTELGDLPLKALKAKGMKRALKDWRDTRASTARTADYGMQVLKRILSWSVENEYIDENPSLGIKGLYKAGSRAASIVMPSELEAILAKASGLGSLLLRFAAETGLRRSDLIKVKWSDLTDLSLTIYTQKSNQTVPVLVPLLAPARQVVAELRARREALKAEDKVPSAFLLTTHHGGPWDKASVTQAWIRARNAAGVEGRTLHDLRGTACTRYIKAGFSDEQLAEIFGWTPEDVRHIRRHYVDREEIARGMIAQLEKAEGKR